MSRKSTTPAVVAPEAAPEVEVAEATDSSSPEAPEAVVEVTVKVSPLKGRKKGTPSLAYLNGICDAKQLREGTSPEELFSWRQKIALRNGIVDPTTNPGGKKFPGGKAPDGTILPAFAAPTTDEGASSEAPSEAPEAPEAASSEAPSEAPAVEAPKATTRRRKAA